MISPSREFEMRIGAVNSVTFPVLNLGFIQALFEPERVRKKVSRVYNPIWLWPPLFGHRIGVGSTKARGWGFRSHGVYLLVIRVWKFALRKFRQSNTLIHINTFVIMASNNSIYPSSDLSNVMPAFIFTLKGLLLTEAELAIPDILKWIISPTLAFIHKLITASRRRS
jgi:hypothetical protein